MRLVVSMPDSRQLGEALARELACAHHAASLHRFPDGEALVRIDADLRDRSVVIAARLDRPDDKVLPLLFEADLARELRASRVGLAAPYLPFMRQDKRFHPGEAVSARSFAALLTHGFDWLVTVDPHLHRYASLDALYGMPARALAAAPAIAQWLRANVPQPLLVGPDEESRQWVERVAHLVDAPFAVLRKERRGDREVRIQGGPLPHAQDRTPVLLDDILSTGRTLAEAARFLLAAGWAAPVAVAVHALVDDQGLDQLRSAGVARVATCNTVPHATSAIDVVPLVARAVGELAGS